MILENDKCYIEIKIDETYTVDSTDNHHYDVVLNPDKYRSNDFSKTLSIHIDLFTNDYFIALIGSYFSYDTDCAILDEEILTILQDDMIRQIKVSDGSIVHNRKIECFGNNFAIYKVKKGYVIYGETEITMLDFDLNQKWSFSGKDIFVSISNHNPFKIQGDIICLYDFEDNYYELDFDGNLWKRL